MNFFFSEKTNRDKNEAIQSIKKKKKVRLKFLVILIDLYLKFDFLLYYNLFVIASQVYIHLDPPLTLASPFYSHSKAKGRKTFFPFRSPGIELKVNPAGRARRPHIFRTRLRE